MKKLFLFASILTGFAAQAHEPMVREDRIWEYLESEEVSNGLGYNKLTKYTFRGVTEIDGKQYHNFVCIGSSSWKMTLTPSGPEYSEFKPFADESTIVAHVREENGKVFLRNPHEMDCWVYAPSNNRYSPFYQLEKHVLSEGEEVEVYNFNLEAGDSFLLPLQPTDFRDGFAYDSRAKYKVTQIVADSDNGRTYTCMPDYDGSDNYVAPDGTEYKFVEGVGNIGKGTFFGFEYIWLIPDTEIYSLDTSIFNNQYDADGNIIYRGLNASNPLAGIHGIPTNDAYDTRMFDLMGREIRNPRPGTIYIQNGHKHIAR